MSHVNESSYTWVDAFQIMLAVGIALAYLSVPFTTLRRVPITVTVKVSAMLFFITCAITHLAMAIGFHDSPWMLVNDLIQLASITTFIVSFSRMVSWAMDRKAAVERLLDQRQATMGPMVAPVAGGAGAPPDTEEPR